MRKVIIVIILGLFFYTFSVSAEILNNDREISIFENIYDSETSLRFSFKLGKVEAIQDSHFNDHFRFILQNASQTADIGEPLLPVFNKIIQVPYGSEIKVKIVEQKKKTYVLDSFGIKGKLLPVQPPRVKNNSALPPFSIDNKTYRLNSFYGKSIDAKKIGIARGYDLRLISIMPILYNPAMNSIEVSDEIEIELQFIGGHISSSQEKIHKHFDPTFEKMMNKLVWNNALQTDEILDLPIFYTVITTSAYIDDLLLLEFIEWKKEKGFTTTLVNTADIGTSTNSIKNYIQTLYDDGEATYIQLVGDTDVVPRWTGQGSSNPATDLTYVLLEGDDFLPDAAIGRFSVADITDLHQILSKVMNYEQVLWSGNNDWNNHAVFMASNDNYEISEGTHNYVIDTHLESDGWTCDKLYQHTYNATTEQVRNAFDEGRNLGIYSGHGSTTSWQDGPPFSQADVNGLVNSVYPFVQSFACLTGKYDNYECFGETWIRATGGAITFWGSSVNSFWDEDDILERTVFDGFYEEELTSIWGMTDFGKYGVYLAYSGAGDTRRYYEMYNILGDPSIDIWTKVPVSISVSYPQMINIGTTTLPLTVNDDIDWALVHVFSDDYSVDAVQYTEGSGTFNIDLGSGPSSPQDMHIVITGHNIQPYEGTIIVTASGGPYCIWNEYTIDDSNGNNNGSIDYGEEITLGMTISNIGSETATDVEVTLSNSCPYIGLMDNTEVYGTIESNQSVTIANAFSFTVSQIIPDEETFSFPIEIAAIEATWNSSLALTAHAPIIVFQHYTVDDGNNNVLEPGETADITLYIKNLGTGFAENVSTIFSINDPYITVNSALANYGDITGGEVDSAVINLTVSSSSPNPYCVYSNLQVNVDGHSFDLLNFLLEVGGFFDNVENGAGNWQPGTDWQITTSENHTPGGAHSWTNIYNNNENSMLITPPLVISDNVQFTFYHKFDIEPYWDGGNVKISTDNGVTWNLITPIDGYPTDIVQSLLEPGYSGNNGYWESESFDLNDFAGQTVLIAFHFASDGSQTGDGWFIDDIHLMGNEPFVTPPTDLQAIVNNDGEVLLSWNYSTINLNSKKKDPSVKKKNPYPQTDDLLYFKVYRSEDDPGDFQQIGTTVDNFFTDHNAVNCVIYYYTVTAFYDEGESVFADPVCIIGGVTGNDPGNVNIPIIYSLGQNYPNPFSAGEGSVKSGTSETTISFSIPEETEVKIEIYNIKGQKVTTLLNAKKSPGYYKIIWNGKNDEQKQIGSGIYLLRMQTDRFTSSRKMSMVK